MADAADAAADARLRGALRVADAATAQPAAQSAAQLTTQPTTQRNADIQGVCEASTTQNTTQTAAQTAAQTTAHINNNNTKKKIAGALGDGRGRNTRTHTPARKFGYLPRTLRGRLSPPRRNSRQHGAWLIRPAGLGCRIVQSCEKKLLKVLAVPNIIRTFAAWMQGNGS